jgi:hypothetical protein
MLLPDESEAREEEEGVLRMNAGRGGLKVERARRPSSFNWSSRRVVSAREDRRSCERLGE